MSERHDLIANRESFYKRLAGLFDFKSACSHCDAANWDRIWGNVWRCRNCGNQLKRYDL